MIVYLDSSVVLRVLFEEEGLIPGWGEWERAFSSELLSVESRRAIDRLRLDSLYDDLRVAEAETQLLEVEAGLQLAPVTRAVLRRASQPFATGVRTLDAIHLATALLLRERMAPDLAFAAHDQRLALGARALGFEVIGV